jgi:YHS domain-containing protein
MRIAAAFLFVLMLLVGGTASVYAGAKAEKQHPVCMNAAGVALDGYDMVSYFVDKKPVKGSSAFAYQYDGATYYFASAQHRDAFAAKPVSYLPQYGGFCAYCMRRGQQVHSDPKSWWVHDGKLYLTVSRSFLALFQSDIDGAIRQADEFWRSLK